MSTTGEMYTTIQYYRPKLATHNGDSLFGCNTVTLVWDDTLEKGVQILGNEIDLEIPVNTPPDSLVVVAHAPLRGDHKIQVFRTKKIGPELAVVSENCSAAVKQIVEAELTPQMLQKSIRPLGVEPIATKGLSYNGLSYFLIHKILMFE